MSDTTSRLALPFLVSGQAQKHVTVNETLLRIDALIQLSVQAATVSVQPSAPVDGDVYILPPGKAGAAWDAMANGALAYYRDGVWEEIAPCEGFVAWVRDTDRLQAFDGGSWADIPGAESPLLAAQRDAGQFQGCKNALVNGAMQVWQRGASFPAASGAGTFAADRWRYSATGTMIHDLYRSTDTPAVAQAGRQFAYSLLVDCQTADVSLAGNEFALIGQSIEGWRWSNFAQRPLVLSFWVKASKTGVHCVALRNLGADRSYVVEYAINAADVWERKVLSIAASPPSGSWDYGANVGVRLDFVLASGVALQTSPNAWQTGNFIATANQVNACDSDANSVRFTGVQLEAAASGGQATPFESTPFDIELAVCQRYFEKSFLHDTAPAQNAGLNTGELQFSAIVAGAATHHSPQIRFRRQKRGAATITLYNPAAANAQVRDITANADCSATAASGDRINGFYLSAAGHASLAVGNRLRAHWTANAEL